MELKSRCCLIPALFVFTCGSVPILAQDTLTTPPAAENPTAPGVGLAGDVDPTAQPPAAPGGRGGGADAFAPGQSGQFFPAGQPFLPSGANAMMPQSPELAKKMRAIMGLRAMWQLRLTAHDIAAILPPLKELAQAEKTLQTKSEQILEDERKALLAADPEGDPPPDTSAELLQRENDLFRIKADDAWRAIDKSIGKDKTNGLRRLVGMGGWQPATADTNGFMLGGPNPLGGDTPRGLGGGPRGSGQPSPDSPKGVFNPRSGQIPQPGGPGAGRGGGPVALLGRGGGGDVWGSAPFMPQMRLSLSELVSLLSDKQTTMRR